MSEYEQRLKTCERVTKTGLAVPIDFLGHQLGNKDCDYCHKLFRASEVDRCLRCFIGFLHCNFEDTYHRDYWCDHCGLVAEQNDHYTDMDLDTCATCGHTRDNHFTEYEPNIPFDMGCIHDSEISTDDNYRCQCKNYQWIGLDKLKIKE